MCRGLFDLYRQDIKGLLLSCRDGKKWTHLKDQQGIKWKGSGIALKNWVKVGGFKMTPRFLACITEKKGLFTKSENIEKGPSL